MDAPVQNSPPETISSLDWSPDGNFLVGGSWDNHVRVWQVQQSGSGIATQPKVQLKQEHKAPVLSCCFSQDGQTVFTAGCDNTAKAWHLQSEQAIQIAQHDAPIKHIAHIPEMSAVVTGSWDRTVRYWDPRQPKEIAKVALKERVYAMDVRHPLLAVGCAEKTMQVVDLRNPTQVYKEIPSALKMQTRCIATFPDKSGFAYGSIEGRVAISHVEDRQKADNFAFKCHRTEEKNRQQECYAVNCISFHPYGTFATAGSDGSYIFWDKQHKIRLKHPSKSAGNPITAAKFNPQGSLYAYAVGYDWSKGHEHYDRSKPNGIFLHMVRDQDIKPRPPKR